MQHVLAEQLEEIENDIGQSKLCKKYCNSEDIQSTTEQGFKSTVGDNYLYTSQYTQCCFSYGSTASVCSPRVW